MPSALPAAIVVQKMLGDFLRSSLFVARVIVFMCLWTLVLPLFASIMTRINTAWVEHYSLKNLLNPIRFMGSVLSTPRESNLVFLPKFLASRLPNQRVRDLVVDILEGQVLIVMLLLLFFIVIIVREWILQNDAFVLELRRAGEEIDNNNNNNNNNNINEDDVHNNNNRANNDAVQVDLNDVARRVQENPRFLQDQEVNNILANNLVQFAQDRGLIENAAVVDDDMWQLPDGPLNDDLDDGGPIDEIDGILNFAGLRGPVGTMLATNLAAQLATGIAICLLYGVPYSLGRLLMFAIGKCVVSPANLGITTVFYGGFILGDMSMFPIASIIGRIVGVSPSWATKEALGLRRQASIEVIRRTFDAMSKPWTPPSAAFGLRILSTSLGYGFFMALVATYISSGLRFASSRQGREAEKMAIRLIKQAEAILKVITVIGIELVVFPIFCGLLLHFSLLPLFESATVSDRVRLTISHPVFSTFLHWALGTLYMFNFAMFVSLCRKIMRRGVLYFVRDPNDANFHPIKDVLERKLLSQLSKIGISAIIYSILIVFCLGGVIHFLRYVLHVSYLPVKFQPKATAEQFLTIAPLIAIYNMSIHMFSRAIRSLNILHKFWSLVFATSCSTLRLSSFILYKPLRQEQGTVYYGSIVARLLLAKPDYTHPVSLEVARNGEWNKAYFVADGTFVRAPNTDSISSRKRYNLFVTVNKDDERLDGLEGVQEDELTQYYVVYRPPNFRIRIALLLCYVWAYGALVVMAVSAFPLYIGRAMAGTILPDFTADLGDGVLVAIGLIPVMAAVFLMDKWSEVKAWTRTVMASMAMSRAVTVCYHAARLVFLGFVFTCIPIFLGVLLDLYITFPLAKVLDSRSSFSVSWLSNFLCGLFEVMAAKDIVLSRFPNSRAAQNYREMIRHGWLNYDFAIAFKFFVLPIYGFVSIAVLLPLVLCWLVVTIFYRDAEPETVSRMFQFSYPALLLWVVAELCFSHVRGVVKRWAIKARDEVYLVGQQLQNLDS
jgi:E3 ubiquitin-protein ligase MARCH6